jgi:spore coat polysaccharide biosynthesis predicted glycosyltransferase SpsG
MKVLQRYLIFADGGNHKGYGHLSRMQAFIKKLGIEDDVICLYENKGQQLFWEEHNFINRCALINVSDILVHNNYILIIDSKDDQSFIFKNLQPHLSKIIAIDNETKFLEKADIQITPTFYSPNRRANDFNQNSLKICSGIDYVIIDKHFLSPHSNEDKIHLTLSFGGYDPNNITLKVLQLIQSQDDLLKDLIVILGPGYKHDVHEIYKFVHSNQVLVNPADIYKIFQRSYVVLTAMGVTVQELFCMGIPSGIIYNYDFDKSDLEKIKYYSSILRPQENLINSFGHFTSIDSVSLYEELYLRKSSNKVFSPLKEAGYMWESFLDDIS